MRKHIRELEKQFFKEEDSEHEEDMKNKIALNMDPSNENPVLEHNYYKQFWCIPLSINVKTFDYDAFAQTQIKHGGRLFDIITIDPPWQLSSANPTRGVAIAYDTLNDGQINGIPFPKLQTDGFIFIWVINNKYRFALDLLDHYKYK